MTTFLKLELASSREADDTYPPSPILINVERISRVVPEYRGARIILDEVPDGPGLTVTTSFEVLLNLLKYTNGRVAVLDGTPRQVAV